MDTPHASRHASRHEDVAVGSPSGAVADVQPLDVTGVRTVGVGTVLFLLAGVVLALFFRDWMADTGRTWWLWTCVAGFGLGLFGYDHCRRRASRGSQRAS